MNEVSIGVASLTEALQHVRTLCGQGTVVAFEFSGSDLTVSATDAITVCVAANLTGGQGGVDSRVRVAFLDLDRVLKAIEPADPSGWVTVRLDDDGLALLIQFKGSRGSNHTVYHAVLDPAGVQKIQERERARMGLSKHSP